MKIGLFGLPKSGKTTLFNALTRSDAPVASYSAKVEPNISIVKVLDPRIDFLSHMYQPRKTTFATIELVDVAGITGDTLRQNTFSGELMRIIRNVDALAIVVRGFTSDFDGPPAEIEEFRKINEELLLTDLIVLEKRLEKLQESHKKGNKSDHTTIEEPLLRKLIDQLNIGKHLRDLDLSPSEQQLLRGFQLFSMKPSMVILNTDEESYGKKEPALKRIGSEMPAVEFAGNFEMELSRLDTEEAQLFMEDMGITESARSKLSRHAYDLLGYISFFTVGSDEVRAWNIKDGATAVVAAGTIHSDLARGFITAECFSYNDLCELGSEKAVREKGRFRLVGKEYTVQDGDILNIRFNI